METIQQHAPLQKLNLTIEINASKEKVWNVLLQDETYRIWTTPFCEGSYFETDWKEGSKALFKAPPSNDGMVSRIATHKPNEIIVIEHLGFLKDGKEDLESEEVKKWQGCREIYKVKEDNGVTSLTIEQDIVEEYAESFEGMWQQALQKVKELSEQ